MPAAVSTSNGTSQYDRRKWAVTQARDAVTCRQAQLEKNRRHLREAMSELREARAKLQAAEDQLKENEAG